LRDSLHRLARDPRSLRNHVTTRCRSDETGDLPRLRS
jgi:hypothetical protein